MAQRLRVYDVTLVGAILRRSEGTPTTFASGKPGHHYSEHVNVTRSGLIDKSHKVTNVATAFLPNHNLQIQAAVAVLNNHVGQGALGFLDVASHTGRRVILEARMPTMTIRCADDTKNWTQEADAACMVIDRTEDDAGIHIHTFFPILFYRHGCPTWWPEGRWQFPTGHPNQI